MKKNIMPTVALASICAIVFLLLASVNLVTAPIIEELRNSAANEALLEVFPAGKDFEEVDPGSLGLSEAVTNAYKETSGSGYVFRVVSTGYKSGMVIMVGIDSEGKITGTKCLETQDTFGKEPLIDNSYNGQSISDFAPNILAGATMTSNGYRDAVNTALQSFVIATGGKLDPSIALEAKIPELAPGFANLTPVENADGFKKVLKASNDTGFAYISSSGDEAFVAIVNATGACRIFDAEGNDVTDAQEAIATQAKAHAKANQTSYLDALSTKITRLFEDASEITSLEIPTFNTVVAAVSFKSNGGEYYGFYSRSIGFKQMDVYLVIDSNGAIAKMDAQQFIFDEEYFFNFGGMDASAYKNGFTGITVDTFTGEQAIIATATMTSDAIKRSTNDSFAAFNAIKGGEQ